MKITNNGPPDERLLLLFNSSTTSFLFIFCRCFMRSAMRREWLATLRYWNILSLGLILVLMLPHFIFIESDTLNSSARCSHRWTSGRSLLPGWSDLSRWSAMMSIAEELQTITSLTKESAQKFKEFHSKYMCRQMRPFQNGMKRNDF